MAKKKPQIKGGIDWESVNQWLRDEVEALLEGELTDEEQEALYDLTDKQWDELTDEFVRLYSNEFREEFVETLREKLREMTFWG
jgi:hypothetical protein